MMKYLFTLLVLALFACEPQKSSSLKTPVEFEEVNHFPYELTAGKFLVIDTQQKMDAVYAVIHKNSVGNRLAPIPSLNNEELYIVFKPELKNTNDVEIKNISVGNDTLFINVQGVDNPQIESSSRIRPNILVKLLRKIPLNHIDINYSK